MDRLPNACDQRVSVLPTDDYVVVSPYTPLSQAIEAMKNDEGGCVIISDDGRVAGIFTERDLLTRILGEKVDLESPISDLAECYPKETMNLPPLPAQVMDSVDGG